MATLPNSPTAPVRPIFLETDFPGLDDPIVRAGATPLAVARCNGWGASPDPVATVRDAAAILRGRRIGTPAALKFEWLFVRTGDVARTDLFLSPDPDRYLWGVGRGILDYSADLAILRPVVAELKRLGFSRLDLGFVDWEGGPSIWAVEKAETDSPELAPKRAEAYRRNWYVIQYCLMDPRISSQLPATLRSIPLDLPAMKAALNPFTGGDLFGPRQRDLAAFFSSLALRTLKRLFSDAGLDAARILSANTGTWKRFVADYNGHQIPSVPVPNGFGANYQLYSPGRVETMRAAAMSDAPGFVPTFNFDASVVDFSERLAVAAPNGAILFAPDPRKADHLIPTIRSYTGISA